jgi:acyl-CoA carboxylase subunit beta
MLESVGRLTSAERVALVADPQSFASFDDEIAPSDPLDFCDRVPYPARLRQAQRQSGSSEAVVTGVCRVGGRPLVLIASEFAFLGGSIGVATAERIARALERAADLRAPVLALVASGGSRMQEGTLALVQMAKLAAAVHRFRRSGGLYITYLMHPTTGGALASWASLGSVTLAQPGALVGFAGPRVAEALAGHPLPQRVQCAEALEAAGWLDDLVEPTALRGRVDELLGILDSPAPQRRSTTSASGAGARPPGRRADAWEDVGHVRSNERFGVRDLLVEWGAPVFEIHGDRSGRADDPSCLSALARVAGRQLAVVAHDRSRRGAGIRPAGLAKARRTIRLARELGLPILTLIDTPGAEISEAAERGGIAGEIALTLEALTAVEVPVVSVLLGQGGSGAAVAFLPADRTLALARAGLWVLAPEGASAILFRDSRHAPELARSQAGAAQALLRHGVVDELVADVPAFSLTAAALEQGIERAFADLAELAPAELQTQRQRRLRALASPSEKDRPLATAAGALPT